MCKCVFDLANEFFMLFIGLTAASVSQESTGEKGLYLLKMQPKHVLGQVSMCLSYFGRLMMTLFHLKTFLCAPYLLRGLLQSTIFLPLLEL